MKKLLLRIFANIYAQDRPLFLVIGIISSIFLLFSCSTAQQFVSNIKKEQYLIGKKESMHKEDFAAHLTHLGNDFIDSTEKDLVPLSQDNINYLTTLVHRLIQNNKKLYHNKLDFKFHVISSNTPFYFSLPGGHYFYSTGIFKKYIKNEELFMAILAIQTFRTSKNIYLRKKIIPVGHINIEQLISLTRIPLHYRNEVNKWASSTLEQAGLDPSIILNWIQMRNRNILDFAIIDGELSVVAREEFAFKNFLVTTQNNRLKQNNQRNSSEEFYKFIHKVVTYNYES